MNIRHVMFFRNDTHLVSCADDKTVRVWDRTSGKVLNRLNNKKECFQIELFCRKCTKSTFPLIRIV